MDGKDRGRRPYVLRLAVGAVSTGPKGAVTPGVRITPEEPAALPMSGKAWSNVLAEAQAPVGIPNIRKLTPSRSAPLQGAIEPDAADLNDCLHATGMDCQ